VPRISLNDTRFEGRTSPLPWGDVGDGGAIECRRCGSSLAGRREEVRRQTTAGIAYIVEIFRCRCGSGRRIKREAAAG
jgi:hypothetical protein